MIYPLSWKVGRVFKKTHHITHLEHYDDITSWTPQLTKTHAKSRRSTAKVQNERCCDTIPWTWSRAPWCVWVPGPPIIMEVENGPIIEETNLVGTHGHHFHDYGRKNIFRDSMTHLLPRKNKWSSWSFWRFRKRIVLFEVGHFIKTHLSIG